MHKARNTHTTRSQALPRLGQTFDVRSALRSRLLSLPFPAFAQAVVLLLERLGYEDVKMVGRAAASGTTFDNEGIGWDVEAVAVSGVNRRKVIVALKQYKPDRLVRRRMADELRGVCLRAGASEALLITTSDLPSTFVRELSAPEHLAPVQVIGGEELFDLCVAHRVGAWEEAGQSPSEPTSYGLDETFFAGLQRTGRTKQKTRKAGSSVDSRADGHGSVPAPLPVVPATITLTLRVQTA